MKEKDPVWLHTFFDAIDAGAACQFLEEAGIPFVIENLTTRNNGVHDFDLLPAIHIELFVEPRDLQRAQACLHETMNLFPDRETDPRLAEPEPEEILSSAMVCDTSTDAESASTFLKDKGIWSTVTQIVDEGDPTLVSYSIDVKGRDIERAIAAMERWCEFL